MRGNYLREAAQDSDRVHRARLRATFAIYNERAYPDGR